MHITLHFESSTPHDPSIKNQTQAILPPLLPTPRHLNNPSPYLNVTASNIPSIHCQRYFLAKNTNGFLIIK
jgi:hypothetical protein